METFYHVTQVDYLDNIRKYGLIPQIGRLSQKLGETVERIYLFQNKDAMENALLNWLGDEFEDENICCLEITVPNYFPIEKNGFECCCYKIIPPNYIRKVVIL